MTPTQNGVADKSARAATPTGPSPQAVLGQAGIANAWQPIETAPKDGRGVLMIDMTAPAPAPGMGYWAGDLWSCVDPSPDEGASIETIQAIVWCSPTHWMPLPAPPAQGTSGFAQDAKQLDPQGAGPTPSGDAP